MRIKLGLRQAVQLNIQFSRKINCVELSTKNLFENTLHRLQKETIKGQQLVEFKSMTS